MHNARIRRHVWMHKPLWCTGLTSQSMESHSSANIRLLKSTSNHFHTVKSHISRAETDRVINAFVELRVRAAALRFAMKNDEKCSR